MCGVTGIYAYTDQVRTWSESDLYAMVNALAHRGPDGSSVHVEPGLFLGHTRLAILDLSSAGRQPMVGATGRFVISFNGEIYNFMELRKNLESCGYSFVSRSDTEVLLAAWEEWGEGCLDRLDGIFAFAIFDRATRQLVLVRDHLGVKPLFYAVDAEEIRFASEPLALFGMQHPVPDSEPEDLDAYFTFNYLPAPRTGLKGVRQLSPGSLLRVGPEGTQLHRYWRIEYSRLTEPMAPTTIRRFEELLTTSVAGQMVSDAPLGLFLSGGLDSYAVALAAAGKGGHPAAFTLGFDASGFDETPAAVAYANHLEIPHQSMQFCWSDESIRETLGNMRELLADASCFPLFQLSRFARSAVTVALAGDGGDELLAGYDTYRAGEITPYIRKLPGCLRHAALRVAGFLPSDNRRYGLRMVVERLIAASEAGPRRDHASFRQIFSSEVKQRLYEPGFFEQVRHYDPVGEYVALMDEVPTERSYLTARQHADLSFHLPSILAKVDRMSMANGLEVRVPLLARAMVEFCANLPDEAKRVGGSGKRILRETVQGRIPGAALKRPKAGFLPPVDRWFRLPGPMFTVFGDYLQAARNRLDLLRWREVEALWDEHRKGKSEAGFILFGVLQYINWSLQCRK